MTYLIDLARRRPVWTLVLILLVAWVWFSPASERRAVVDRSAVATTNPLPNLLNDDRIEDKHPAFSEALVDSRPYSGWDINASAAVMRLDIEPLSGQPAELEELHPSYAAAAQSMETIGSHAILPSINSLDGKAKQFDDGLMAAIISLGAPQRGLGYQRAQKVLGRMLGRLPKNSAAFAWVFAALQIGGYLDARQIGQSPAASAKIVAEFISSPAAKPLAFYSWTSDLERLWRFHRFLQQGLTADSAAQLRDILAADQVLASDYSDLVDFFSHLSNPPAPDTPSLKTANGSYFLPPMGSRETELVAKLFGGARIPPGADLMREFVTAIRSGAVDLKPRPGSGWYDHQTYALETFLLAERGPEHQKLLLTRAYKQRMLDAFKALLTKRRETHAMAAPAAAAPPPPRVPVVEPLLRVEPNPTFYLRTARSYAFIEQFLQTRVPQEQRKRLTGLAEEGPRDLPLEQELATMKNLFYGLHLISSEDIGMKPELMSDELRDPAQAKAAAEKYLLAWHADRDLKADTRVCVPVVDGRSWCTIGVRATTLFATYAIPPRGRPTGSLGEWQELKSGYSRYLLLADEFAEVTTPNPLSRKELRAVVDREKTRDRIVAALAGKT